ncbi:MAG: hypothetical protein GW809_04175 [Bacteroidetes bacterium]|nr:hypothetical protein [Bacteroidota bacterium]
MEKSIESIWKDGFLKKDALVAPKINELYKQKSIHIIDKIKRMMKMNLYAIFGFAVINSGIYVALGTPITGIVIFFLLMGVCWVSIKQAKTLKNIDSNLSSYDYIMTFRTWLNLAISNNSKVMRFIYPLAFLAALMPIIHALKTVKVTQEAITQSSLHLMYGIPTVMWLIAIAIAGAMFVYGDKIYKWDVSLVYSRVFQKLDELIADMEELKK